MRERARVALQAHERPVHSRRSRGLGGHRLHGVGRRRQQQAGIATRNSRLALTEEGVRAKRVRGETRGCDGHGLRQRAPRRLAGNPGGVLCRLHLPPLALGLCRDRRLQVPLKE